MRRSGRGRLGDLGGSTAARVGAGWSHFDHRVFALVRRVPMGAVVTYGQIAALLGTPAAARAVGRAMRHCPAGVPWQRVVNARGGISPRPNLEGMLRQRLLLEQEGVRFARGRIDLRRFAWRNGRGRRNAVTGAGVAR